MLADLAFVCVAGGAFGLLLVVVEVVAMILARRRRRRAWRLYGARRAWGRGRYAL